MDFYVGEVICQTEDIAAVRTFFEGFGVTSIEIDGARVKVVTNLIQHDQLMMKMAQLRAQCPRIRVSKFTVWEGPERE